MDSPVQRAHLTGGDEISRFELTILRIQDVSGTRLERDPTSYPDRSAGVEQREGRACQSDGLLERRVLPLEVAAHPESPDRMAWIDHDRPVTHEPRRVEDRLARVVDSNARVEEFRVFGVDYREACRQRHVRRHRRARREVHPTPAARATADGGHAVERLFVA